MKTKLCCWCDETASKAIRYAGIDHPACDAHHAEYSQPIRYSNEDYDRINRAIRYPEHYRIEDKHSGIGRNVTGSLDEAINAATAACSTDTAVWCVWDDQGKLAECTMRGLRWQRGHFNHPLHGIVPTD